MHSRLSMTSMNLSGKCLQVSRINMIITQIKRQADWGKYFHQIYQGKVSINIAQKAHEIEFMCEIWKIKYKAGEKKNDGGTDKWLMAIEVIKISLEFRCLYPWNNPTSGTIT